jgi:hypothetical protein
MAMPPGVKPEPKTSFSAADRRKALEMLGRGEPEQTVKAFFKALGYPEGLVASELEKLQSVKVEMPAEEAREGSLMVVGGIAKKRYTLKWGFAILCVVLLALLGTILWAALPMLSPLLGYEAEKQPVYWDVGVTTQSCSSGEWKIKVVNAFLQPLPEPVTFTVRENGAVCEPATDLKPATGGDSLTCSCSAPGCSFTKGNAYSITSRYVKPTGDAC